MSDEKTTGPMLASSSPALAKPTATLTSTYLLRRVGAVFLAALGCVWLLSGSSHRSYSFFSKNDSTGSSPKDIYNTTLGFEKIFVVSMPGRTDRQDALTLTSSVVDFDFELVDGVTDQDVVPDAWPIIRMGAEKEQERGTVGCWRAHLNVLHKIVHENIQSALIFEDDTDFDVTIKDQLAHFAEGLHALTPSTSTSPSTSPYGDSWDMLWPGYCFIGSSKSPRQFYVTENDPTVIPIPKRHALLLDRTIPPLIAASNSTRITFKSEQWGMCMYGYAVTYAGARKALAALSLLPRAMPIDDLYRDICHGVYQNLQFDCYSTYPPLFGSTRPRGTHSRDTDINHELQYMADAAHEAYTFDIVYSTKLNLWDIVSGKGAMVRAQYADDERYPPRRLGEKLRRGRSYLLDVDTREMDEELVYGVNTGVNAGWITRPTTWLPEEERGGELVFD